MNRVNASPEPCGARMHCGAGAESGYMSAIACPKPMSNPPITRIKAQTVRWPKIPSIHPSRQERAVRFRRRLVRRMLCGG
jgi:hypothetical protein